MLAFEDRNRTCGRCGDSNIERVRMPTRERPAVEWGCRACWFTWTEMPTEESPGDLLRRVEDEIHSTRPHATHTGYAQTRAPYVKGGIAFIFASGARTVFGWVEIGPDGRDRVVIGFEPPGS